MSLSIDAIITGAGTSHYASRDLGVRVEYTGDKYGLNDQLIHSGTDPMLEIYCMPEDPQSGKPWLVSRYTLPVLDAQVKGGRGLLIEEDFNGKFALSVEQAASLHEKVIADYRANLEAYFD